MSDFDFDVVTGPSQASCPAAPAEPTAEDEARPAEAAHQAVASGS